MLPYALSVAVRLLAEPVHPADDGINFLCVHKPLQSVHKPPGERKSEGAESENGDMDPYFLTHTIWKQYGS